MAGTVWDWPNQQTVRVDESGPGWDTPANISTDAIVTYGNAGRSYEFLLKLSSGGAVTGHGTVDWDFGDGTTQNGVSSTVPATHTYAEAGTVAVRGKIGQATRSTMVVVT